MPAQKVWLEEDSQLAAGCLPLTTADLSESHPIHI